MRIDVHVYHHFDPDHTRPNPVEKIILAALEESKRTMSDLADAIAELTKDETDLITEVDQLIDAVTGIPAVVTAAVTKALDAANVDAAAAAAAVRSVTAAVTAETAKALAALPPRSTPPAPVALDVTGVTLSGQVGVAYTGAVAASGGTAPYTFAADGLPSGLSIDATSGAISGTPDTAGGGAVGFSVSDAATPPATASATATISISA